MLKAIFHACKDLLKGKPFQIRSSKWYSLRDKFLKENPKCRACGSETKLQVHHKIPFHIQPELELNEDNLITLCEDKDGYQCHFKLGHLCNWRSFNPNIDKDALESLLAKTKKNKTNYSTPNLR